MVTQDIRRVCWMEKHTLPCGVQVQTLHCGPRCGSSCRMICGWQVSQTAVCVCAGRPKTTCSPLATVYSKQQQTLLGAVQHHSVPRPSSVAPQQSTVSIEYNTMYCMIQFVYLPTEHMSYTPSSFVPRVSCPPGCCAALQFSAQTVCLNPPWMMIYRCQEVHWELLPFVAPTQRGSD